MRLWLSTHGFPLVVLCAKDRDARDLSAGQRGLAYSKEAQRLRWLQMQGWL